MSTYGIRWLLLATLVGRVIGEGTSTNSSPSSKTSSAGGSSSTTLSPAAAAAAKAAEEHNKQYAHFTLVTLAAAVFLFAVYRVILHAVRYIRTLTCLNNEKQMYFKSPNLTFGSLKEHLLYALLFRRRHNEELHITSGWSFGMLPTRFQSLFLTGLIGMNVVLCVISIDWNNRNTSAMLTQLRNRTGTLSVVNMIPLVVLAGRNNPLVGLLNISFDSFNLVHRWFGRIVAVEAVVHTLAWTIKKVNSAGWKEVSKSLQSSTLIMTGFIGTVTMVFMIFQASAVLRRAFYETFLHLHIALAVLAIGGIWVHLDGLGPQIYIKIVVVAWAAERLLRLAILVYRNIGKGGTKATVEALPGDAVRITLQMARPWAFRPGQHMYLTMPSVGLWTSHPFSVAWSNEEERLESEKGGLAMSRQDILAMQKTSMSLVIRRRDGFTNTLFKRAENAPEGRYVTSAFAEGPYGAMHSLHSYGTVMMFAGGVGITHQVPYVRDLVNGFANGTVAARRVILVWVIQSPEHLEWIRPWMTSILALDKRRDILRIQLFVTRPRSTKEIHSPSTTVQMFPGRPNVDTLVGMESENQVGAMAVTVCGTGGLSDDVRRAVRKRQGMRNIDFVEESFSW